MERSDARAQTTNSTSTLKKPAVKQTTTSAARQASLADRLSKPTTASTTKSTTSNLDRAPIRPTLAASARKPTTGSFTSARAHSRLGTNDGKVTDDGAEDEGGLVKTGRTSIAQATNRPGAPVPVRKPSTAAITTRAGATSPAVSRASVRSPITTRTTLSKTSNATIRPKPATATVNRPGSAASGRKPFNAVPTPSVARTTINSVGGDGTRNSLKRPTLGTRKSTHSVLIEQQIREFELVNQMLQQAMSTEAIDTEEKEVLESEAAETMTKLRTTLSKVRRFEKRHGRVPSEAELAEISSIDETISDAEKTFEPNESLMSGRASVAGEHAHTLREELNESRAYTVQLEQQIQDMTTKLKEFSEEAEAESEKIEEAAAGAKGDHAQQLREISSTNQKRMDHLRNVHYEEMQELREQHQRQVEELTRNSESDMSGKDDALQRLQEQVDSLGKQKDDIMNDLQARESDLTTLRTELVELKQQHADATDNHVAELDKLKAAADIVLVKNKDGEAEWQKQLQTLQEELDRARNESSELAQKSAEIDELKALLQAERSKAPDTSKQDAEIIQLSEALQDAKKYESQAAELDNEVSQLKARLDQTLDAEKKLDELQQELSKTKSELEAERTKPREVSEASVDRTRPRTLSEAPTSSSRDVSPIKSDAEKEELRKSLAAFQKRHQAAKENAKAKSAKQAEEHAARMAEQLKNHEDALNQSRSDIAQLQTDLDAKQVELQNLQTTHVEELEKLKNELEAASENQRSLENTVKEGEKHKQELEKATLTIEGLRENVDNLEQERNERDEAAAKTLAEQKEHQSKQLESTIAQLDTVQSELEHLKTSSAKELSAELSKLQQELAKAHDELYATRAGHDEALKDLQKQLAESRQASDNAELEHKKNLEQAQQHADDMLRSYENTKTDLENQLETSKNQLQESQRTLEDFKKVAAEEAEEALSRLREEHHQNVTELKAEHHRRLQQLEEEGNTMMSNLDELEKAHADEIAKIQAEALESREAAMREQNTEHNRAVAELKAENRKRLQQLEEDGKTMMTSLDELEKAHADEIARMQADALESQEAAIRQQSTDYDRAIAELRENQKSLSDKLEVTKENHTKELDQLRAEHATQLSKVEAQPKGVPEDEVEALKASHAETLSKLENHNRELQSQVEARSKGVPEDEVEALKASHAETLSKLEDHNRELQSQVEGNRFQLQTMKGIFADQEKQNAEKEEEHEKELQFERDQFSQAVMKISNHGAQLMQKDAEHSQAIEALRKELHSEHNVAMTNLTEDHQSAIREATSRFETEQNILRETLAAEHDDALRSLQESVNVKDVDIEQFRADHLEALEHTKSAADSRHKELLEAMTLENEKKLEELRHELESSYRVLLDKGEAQRNESVTELTKALENLRQEHEETLKSVNDGHQKVVAAFELELANTKAVTDQMTAQNASNTAIEEQLRAELAQTYSKIEIMVADYEKASRKASEEHAIALRDLRQELDNVRQQLDHRPDRSAEMEALKKDIEKAEAMSTTIDELRKQKDELYVQYSALQMASQQHLRRAEAAEGEVKELKKAAQPSPRAAAVSPSLSSKIKSVTNGAFSTPKNSLQSSRWASVDPPASKGLNAAAPSFAPSDGALSDGAVGLGLRRESINGHDDGRQKPRERNVHGQLAGINEDIRALNDLSERMFAESRLLAKTLSRVDEETGRLEPESDRVTVVEEEEA